MQVITRWRRDKDLQADAADLQDDVIRINL
jgi:hypothetical protein